MLFAGQRLTIQVGTRKEFDTLRVLLHREHQTPAAIGLSDDSLCSRYDPEKETGEFWLGEARMKRKKSWNIVDDGSE